MNSKDKVNLLNTLLQECREESSRANTASPVVSNIMQEILGFCTSCKGSAIEDGGEKFVPISSILNLEAWAQHRARELDRIVNQKAGEVIAYEKALEILKMEESPGPAAGQLHLPDQINRR
jgi:hypothetical protein